MLSPSSTRADRFTKRRLYQEVGVATYWMVDADAQQVEVWTPDATFPVIVRDELTRIAPGAVEPLRISLERLLKPL